MKRYLAFGGDEFYSQGGWGDFKESFDDVETAKTFLLKESLDWWHVIDSTDGSYVGSSYIQ